MGVPLGTANGNHLLTTVLVIDPVRAVLGVGRNFLGSPVVILVYELEPWLVIRNAHLLHLPVALVSSITYR